MSIKEVFFQAFDSLRANKLRSSLTLLALVVGVFSVIVSTTAVAVLDNFFQNTMSMMGGDVINISRTPSVQMGDGDRRSLRNRQQITFETAEELQERLKLAGEISPDEVFDYTKVVYGEEETEPTVRVVGSNEYYLNNNAYELQDGRNFNSEDVRYARPLALIGSEIREDLFQTEYPVGKNIRVAGHQYRVVGILNEKGSIFGQSFG